MADGFNVFKMKQMTPGWYYLQVNALPSHESHGPEDDIPLKLRMNCWLAGSNTPGCVAPKLISIWSLVGETVGELK